MHRKWPVAVTLSILLSSQATVAEDWKSELAKKTVGNRSYGAIVTLVSVGLAGILCMPVVAQQRPAAPKTQWAATNVLPLNVRAGVGQVRQKLPGDALDHSHARSRLAGQSRPYISRHARGRTRAGNRIADDCKADPNGLLFAIVDKHVRHFAEVPTGSGK